MPAQAQEAGGTRVITGYRAVVSPAALGRGLEAIAPVEVAATDVGSLRRFEATVAALDAHAVCRMTELVTIPGVHRVISHLTVEVIKSET